MDKEEDKPEMSRFGQKKLKSGWIFERDLTSRTETVAKCEYGAHCFAINLRKVSAI